MNIIYIHIYTSSLLGSTQMIFPKSSPSSWVGMLVSTLDLPEYIYPIPYTYSIHIYHIFIPYTYSIYTYITYSFHIHIPYTHISHIHSIYIPYTFYMHSICILYASAYPIESGIRWGPRLSGAELVGRLGCWSPWGRCHSEKSRDVI